MTVFEPASLGPSTLLLFPRAVPGVEPHLFFVLATFGFQLFLLRSGGIRFRFR